MFIFQKIQQFWRRKLRKSEYVLIGSRCQMGRNIRHDYRYDPNRKCKMSKAMKTYLSTISQKESRTFEKNPLSFIRSETEYYQRLDEYECGKKTRNIVFFHRKGLQYKRVARKMYYDAVRLIYFLSEGVERMKEVLNFYDKEIHRENMKKLIISLRKLAQCCYELGNDKEAYEICCFVIKIVKEQNLPQRYTYLTYGVMASTLSKNNDLLHLADIACSEGLRLKDSPILLDLRRKIKDKEAFSRPFFGETSEKEIPLHNRLIDDNPDFEWNGPFLTSGNRKWVIPRVSSRFHVQQFSVLVTTD